MSSSYRALNHSSEDISMSDIDTSYYNSTSQPTAEEGQRRIVSDPTNSDAKSKLVATRGTREISSSPANSHLLLQQRRTPFFTIWWKEFIACFLAVAAAFAILGTLYPYQGRPLPQWPYLITVNALLSAYMVVLKASATFLLAEGIGQQKWRWFDERERPLYDIALHDEATRGPWGALKLLTEVSLTHVWHWLGCILILLALFVDPFVQQVLHYSECNVLENSTAILPRSNFFAAGGPHAGARLVTITSDEQASINAGISAPGGHVEQQCASGNCTYPEYSTIGYCSSCEDISDAIQFEWLNYTDSYNQSFRGMISYIPDGLQVEFVKMGSSNFSVLSDLDRGSFQYLVGVPVDGSNGQQAAHAIDPITEKPPTGCDDAATNGTWRCRGYGAANCSLYPCVRTYNASVRNGALQDDLIKETAQLPSVFGYDLNGQYFTTLNASCLTPDEKSLLTGEGYTINTTTDWIPYNNSYSPLLNQSMDGRSNNTKLLDFEVTIKRRGCMYAIENDFVNSLAGNYLDYAWTGNLTGYWNTDDYGITLFEGPQMLQSLFNFGQFGFERTNSMFKNISDSLTNHMRTTPGFEGPDLFNLGFAAEGQVWQDKTCLRVEWAWLAMPFALVAFTLVFFEGVLVSQGSVPHDVRTWKSSPLPLVFHGPGLREMDGKGGYGGRDLRSVSGMEHFARRVNVRLVRDGDGGMRLQEKF